VLGFVAILPILGTLAMLGTLHEHWEYWARAEIVFRTAHTNLETKAYT
jgi:hypothetical protein